MAAWKSDGEWRRSGEGNGRCGWQPWRARPVVASHRHAEALWYDEERPIDGMESPMRGAACWTLEWEEPRDLSLRLGERATQGAVGARGEGTGPMAGLGRRRPHPLSGVSRSGRCLGRDEHCRSPAPLHGHRACAASRGPEKDRAGRAPRCENSGTPKTARQHLPKTPTKEGDPVPPRHAPSSARAPAGVRPASAPRDAAAGGAWRRRRPPRRTATP